MQANPQPEGITVMSPQTRFESLHARNAHAAADLGWYPAARAEIRRRARGHGLPERRYAAIVAAMSPCMQWRSKSGGWPNLDAADRIVNGEARGLPAAVSMALRILDGAAPLAVLGPKTSAFYRNLTRRDDAVTIDRWMMRAAGMPTDHPTPRQYAALSDALRAAAANLNLHPHDLQASIWAQVKRESETA